MAEREVMYVRDLKTSFHTPYGVVRAVNGVSFQVKPGETLGIVGESGCGKSVTALSLLNLVSSPGKIESGEVWIENIDLLALNKKQLRKIRGRIVATIFQDPSASLNPIFTIGRQLTETLMAHKSMTQKDSRAQAIELLNKMGLDAQNNYFDRYPFQLSGGQCQRVMIAMALALSPKVLVADEPTTALDVTIQAQILQELELMKAEIDTGVILITHDLAVVAENAQEVAVMYAGYIVECGPVKDVFQHPAHPYTEALLGSFPRLSGGEKDLKYIEGRPPDLLSLPEGCPFAPRCQVSVPNCGNNNPLLSEVSPRHLAACHHIMTNQEVVVHA